MRVTRNDGMKTGRSWIHIELCEIMKYVNERLTDPEDFGVVQHRRPRALVVVAAHGSHGPKPRKLLDYAGVTNVAVTPVATVLVILTAADLVLAGTVATLAWNLGRRAA